MIISANDLVAYASVSPILQPPRGADPNAVRGHRGAYPVTPCTPPAPVASGMPNTPVSIVRFDPNAPTDKTIAAGTALGLYWTQDGGTTSSRYGVGLPIVRVCDIFIARNGSLIRVATYGRGVWEIYP